MTVLITDHGFNDVNQELAITQAAGFELDVAQCKSPDEVILRAKAADALLVQWAPISADVIPNLDACKVIVRYGIGYDNIDVVAARAKGIRVCNVPDYCADEVADHALALALALARRLPQTHARTIAGTWSIKPPGSVSSFSTMLFATAGFGRIAREVLKRARAFGFRVGAYDPFVTSAKFAEAGVECLSETALFHESDILSLHLPLGAKTKHFVSAKCLGEMKTSSILINTSRGGLVDTCAHAVALLEGRLAGAGLDVYEVEPLQNDHPLRNAPNTILTSHTAWFSDESVPRLQRLAAEEVVRGLLGEPLLHPVS